MLLGQCPGLDLGPKQLERFGAGADEREARLFAATGEIRALGEKAVAGVDGVTAGLAGDREQLLDIEIGRHAPALEGAGQVGLARM